MAGDILETLFTEDKATEAAPPAPAPEVTPEAQAQAPESQPRAPDGKFASKEPSQAPAEPVQDDPEKQPVNRAEFKGYLDERDKRQKAEARILELERQVKERQTPPDFSSIQNDPAAIEQHIQSARNDAVFSFSEKVARKDHGDEIVQSAMDWGLQRARQNPAFQAEYLRQEHPIEWAVKQFKRDKILTEIGDDPDAFIEARIAARLAQSGTAQPQTEPQPSSAVPPLAVPPAPKAPRSIASTPSAGSQHTVASGPGNAFEAAFRP